MWNPQEKRGNTMAVKYAYAEKLNQFDLDNFDFQKPISLSNEKPWTNYYCYCIF